MMSTAAFQSMPVGGPLAAAVSHRYTFKPISPVQIAKESSMTTCSAAAAALNSDGHVLRGNGVGLKDTAFGARSYDADG